MDVQLQKEKNQILGLALFLTFSYYFFFHAHINIRNFYIYTENIILVSVTTDIRPTPGIHTQEKTSRFTQNTLTIDKNNTAIKCNLFSATRIMLISFRVKIQER